MDKPVNPQGIIEKDKLWCSRPKGKITGVCVLGHEYETYIRCRKCENCQKWKIRVWVAKCITRFISNCENVTQVYMWQLGTNWNDTVENRERIYTAFTKLRKRLNKRSVEWNLLPQYEKFKPLLWVMEVGSKGGKLHIHMVVEDWIDIKMLKLDWSELTGIETPYVSYTDPKDYERSSPLSAMIYLSKYLSKDIKNYYWMGKMLKKVEKKKLDCRVELFDELCNYPMFKYIIGTENWEIINLMAEFKE